MTAPVHVHYWHIETVTPGVTMVGGHCDCGAEREFQAWADEDLDLPKASWREHAKRRKAKWGELHGLDDFA